MVKDVIQIKSRITISVDASAGNIIHVKKFGILLHVVAKIVNIYQVSLAIQ